MPTLLYEPDEHPPYTLAFGISVQRVMAMAPSLVLIPTIIMRTAEQDETYLAWAIFAMLVVNAAMTVVQTVRIGHLGSGYPLVMVTSSAFIGVCISALGAGGPSLMATLLLVAAGFQFALATRLSLLRRFITPMVTGTLLVLIAVSIMPALFRMLTTVPDGTPWAAAPTSAAVTFVTVVALLLRASERWRLWAPLIGITVGCAVAAPFGLYDPVPIGAAPWIGFPQNAWPGLGPDVRTCLLVSPARLPVRHADRHDGDPRPCRLHPAGLVAPATGDRSPLGPGRGGHCRLEQSAV